MLCLCHSIPPTPSSSSSSSSSSRHHSPSPLPPPISLRLAFRSGFVSLLMAASLTSCAAPLLPPDTLNNVPPSLSGGEKARRIQKPKSAKAESCTRRCVATCIQGGGGGPGEGPLNVRRPLVVFKDGFRTRQYCLVECSEICNLIGD